MKSGEYMAMENSKVNISLPADLIPFINELKGGKSIDDKVKISVAIELFTSKIVTLARAADISGYSLADFIDILINRGIYWSEYTEDKFEQDMGTINSILEEDELFNE